ncbi:Putative esterase [Gemmata sp. SH-PL17]|uniref:alpha/beta hydrolase n=1 Tax=Gemmata sp. SH-PL17 TaxID=1630693 RepID=UPI00078C6E40|nr:alpha/beta hydrolase-fold protein [Gemmata sp. SH-PL17]AMV27968.1 Putative esterase [Gemmata sp. SH-PL17]
MPDGWTQTAIGGKLVDVFDPPNALPQALLYLHGLDERTPATDANFMAALRTHRLRCVAPHGGQCWWADRVCSEFDADLTPERYLLDALVPWAESAWRLGPRAIAIGGVEMGGQGALRLAFKHPERFPIAASVSGALDCQDWYGRGTPLDEIYDSRERCRQDTAVLHIHAHRWPPHLWFCCAPTDAAHYRGNDRLIEKLTAVGVPHTADLDTRAKPGVRYEDQMVAPMLAFVADALSREAKRLM